MGESIKGESRADIAEAGGIVGERNGGRSPSPADPRTDAGTGGTGGDGGTGGKNEAEKKPAGLAIVTDDQKRIERNEKRRERYAKQKAESGQTVKPRKVNRTKKKSEPQIDTAQINLLLATLSSVIATRRGFEHWKLSESECTAISEPLAKVLANTPAFEQIANNANGVALLIACVTIFLPRVVITAGNLKNEKETKNAVKAGKAKESALGSDRRNDRKPAADGAHDGTDVPWYGNAVY